MRIRRPWIVAAFMLLALTGWSHERWRQQLTEMLERMRTGQFVEEASRSQTFLLNDDRWLEFDIPLHGTIVRVLTNSGVEEIPEQVASLGEERPGWRYSVDYQIVDGAGKILRESTYHFRTQLTEYINPETGETFTAATFADTALYPTGTRSMQHPLGGYDTPPTRFRMRLADKDAALAEVGVRIYCRKERPGYQNLATWQRTSYSRRERLCQASVYPPDLVSLAERRNLLRWQWLPLPPRGLEGVDYQRRVLYTLVGANLQKVGAKVTPLGQAMQKGLLASIPLPAELGTARIELERIITLDAEPEPILVEVQWYGQNIHQRRNFEINLIDNVTDFDFPAEGGLLVFSADTEIAARVAWLPASAPEHEDFRDITPQRTYVQTYRTDSKQSVSYTITHIDPWPTPFRVVLRRQILGEVTTGDEPQLADLQPAHVTWQFLDNYHKVVAEGKFQAGDIVSTFDYDTKNKLYVTEPTSYYFAVPLEVHHVRFLSSAPSILLSCFTRPPDLAKITRIPEDYSAFSRSDSTSRNWFMLRPDSHLRLLEEARTVSIRVRPRPPEDNAEMLAGRFLWEDFRPAGFWQARYLLAPRNPEVPIRDEALKVTFLELETGRDYDADFIRDPNRSAIEPRLIYVKEDSSAKTLDVLLNGTVYHTATLRAPRGEIVLPPIANDTCAAIHTIRVRADGPVRVFANSLKLSEQPAYLKRMALRLQGKLRFEYDKKTPEKEVLALWFYGDADRRTRATVRVQITLPPSCGTIPSGDWTIRQREFDLKPTGKGERSIVLGTADKYMGSGRVCYIPLGEDLPVGRYPIEIELIQGEHGYVVLSKTTAGTAIERTFHVDRAIDRPLIPAP